MNLLLLFFAALSLHRIWNYEDIAAPVRALFPWKMFSCEVCNPAWIAAAVAGAGLALGLLAWPIALVFPFAAYLPIRSMVWVYDHIEGVRAGVTVTAPEAPKKCSGCAEKQADLAAQREKALAYKERVVILTAYTSLSPQIAMLASVLAREKDRQVQVWLSAAATPEALEAANRSQPQIGSNVVIRAVVPFAPDEKVDQIADEKTVAQLSGEIGMQLMTLGNAKVLTVDALYDPHLLPLAQALQQFSQTKAFAWVHFVSGAFGWEPPTDPTIARARAYIPKGHRLAANSMNSREAWSFYRADAAANGLVMTSVAGPSDLADAIAKAKPIA
jgi:hypothetical protein